MSILEMCNESSISAYESELERQKSLNARTDLLFKWLTLLIAVFNFLISFLTKFDIDMSFDSELFKCYAGMMLFFFLAFIIILYINFPVKRKLPSLGSEQLKRIQKKLGENHSEYDTVYREALYEKMLENDVITKALRSYNQRIAIAVMVAEILMVLGLVSATVMMVCCVWKG